MTPINYLLLGQPPPLPWPLFAPLHNPNGNPLVILNACLNASCQSLLPHLRGGGLALAPQPPRGAPPPLTCCAAPAPAGGPSSPCACALEGQQPPGRHRVLRMLQGTLLASPGEPSPQEAHLGPFSLCSCLCSTCSHSPQGRRVCVESHRQALEPDRAGLHQLSVSPHKTYTRPAGCLSQHNPDSLQCLPRLSFIPTGLNLPL